MNSVIIPAHNEASVIGRTLSALLAGADPGELEIIVVCNGCTDDTASIAATYDPRVRVIESDRSSKSYALNLGDQAAIGFPRFYVDADVVFTLESLRRVAAALEAGWVLAAAPRPHLDFSRSNWLVQAYYAIDQRLPWFREGIGNSGVYALSQVGRARFREFPDITTDDSFVRLHFKPNERLTLHDAASVVTAPADLRSLIAIKTRSHFSKWEIDDCCPELRVNAGPRNAPVLGRLALNPRNWLGLMVYGYVKIMARIRCRMRYRLHRSNLWERDKSSRQVLPPGSALRGAPAAAPAVAVKGSSPMERSR